MTAHMDHWQAQEQLHAQHHAHNAAECECVCARNICSSALPASECSTAHGENTKCASFLNKRSHASEVLLSAWVGPWSAAHKKCCGRGRG
eukprot:1611427-Alexandrium_andersonii.AAC.1